MGKYINYLDEVLSYPEDAGYIYVEQIAVAHEPKVSLDVKA